MAAGASSTNLAASTEKEDVIIQRIGLEVADLLESRFDSILSRHTAQLHDRLVKSLQGSVPLASRSEKRKPSSKRFGTPAELSARSSNKDKLASRTLEEKPGARTLEGVSEIIAASGVGNKKASVPSLIEMESAILHGIGSIRFPPSSSSIQCSSNYPPAADLDESDEDFRDSFGPRPRSKISAVVPHHNGAGKFTAESIESQGSGQGSLQLPGPRPPGPQRQLSGDRVVLSPRTGQATRCNNMESMVRDSQSQILDQLTADPSFSKLEQVDHDPASRLMLAFPRWLHLLVALLTFSQAAGYITLKSMGYIETNSSVFTFISAVVYGTLATICVHLLRKALRSTDLNLAVDRLHLFVADFELQWSQVSGKEWRGYVIVWCLIVLVYSGAQGLQAWMMKQGGAPENAVGIQIAVHVMQIVMVLSFALSSAVVMLAAYVQSHLLLGLDKSLDCWCCQVINTPAFDFGVQSWNSLQALLKCVGRELASSFLSFQVLGALGFFYFLASTVAYAFRTQFEALPIVVEASSSMPLLFLFVLSMRLFAKGAALTEKCRAVPAFVNQIPTTKWIDFDRQYLVTFITDSSPGFFVREVKISQEMFIKQFIVVGGLLSGLFGALSRLYLY